MGCGICVVSFLSWTLNPGIGWVRQVGGAAGLAVLPAGCGCLRRLLPGPERKLFLDNLLVRIRFFIVMIWWTGLALWEFDFPFPGPLPHSGR